MTIATHSLPRAARRRTAEPLRPPWAADDFLQKCAHCGDCVRACPEGVLEKDKRGRPFLNLEAGTCTFCQACVRVCSTGALFSDAEQEPRVIS
ncbi:4Fe-4S dicluster domain-containing protein [Thioflexithrix psekupsensis]|uniref:4Fe-4S ferredoxin-type domain-containing protein n=1 Tax=Thioflexithrix psekupsensis TaxID=1570016 RepID=A0A251X5C9_9GAMM|nr:4Fe-4S dicluster domain-containing protein [Thioflexithrix psekupsensis]OUD12631.1 hypothetical protein TPSD3_16270 [Thioflexithrix psekupsensis]